MGDSDPTLLAIDQGTSSSRSIAFSARGAVLALNQHPFEQIYPASGWVEHDPEVIWATTLSRTWGWEVRLRNAGVLILTLQ